MVETMSETDVWEESISVYLDIEEVAFILQSDSLYVDGEERVR